MSQDHSTARRLPKGVTELPRSRGGRRFLAKIRHKGVEVHLGIYESAGLAGFAFNVASQAIGRGSRPPNEIPGDEQPDASGVWRITNRVRHRLGLDSPTRTLEEVPPDPEALLTLFEITVVGFWRDQAARSDSASDVDAAARRLAEAARVVFWSPTIGHPSPRRRHRPAGRPADRSGVPSGGSDPGDPRRRRRRGLAGRPMAGPARRLSDRPGVRRRGPLSLC